MSDTNVLKLARRIARIEQRLNTFATPQLVYSSLDDGYIEERDAEGNPVGRIGRQRDGSHGYVVIDGPTPPTPSAPTVEGGPGYLVVRWDGTFTDADVPTADHRGVEVHVAETDAFDPDLDVDSATRHAWIASPEGGEVTVAKPAGTYYVRLITRTAPGKYGEPSATAAVEVEHILSEEDLAALEEALDEAASAIETLREVDLPALASRLQEAEDAVRTVLETDLPALEARLQEAEDAVANVRDVELPALDERLGEAEAAVEQVTESTLPAIQGELADNASAIAAAKDRLDTAFGVNQAFDVTQVINTAKAEAIQAAAQDAQAKADAARQAAEQAAKDYADGAIDEATYQALQQAAADAQAKADAAKALAEAAAKAYTDAVAADLTADIATAQQTAQQAMATASGKATVYYDTGNPTGSGSAVGDIWRKRNATTGAIDAEWYWNGSQWVPVNYGDGVLRSLDVGKLTAGSATIDQAVINALAVNIATVIQLNADRITSGKLTANQIDVNGLAAAIATVIELNASRITSGTISAERLDAQEIAAAVGTYLELNASQITSGTISTARLDAQEIAGAIATVIELNASRITSGTLSTARLNATEVAAAVANVIELNASRITTGTLNTARLNATEVAAAVANVIQLNASRIVSGTIDTARLNTTQIAAAIANIVTVKAENIQAGTIQANLAIETNGSLRVGATNQPHVIAAGGAVKVLTPASTNPDGSTTPAKELIVVGGNAAFTAFDEYGDELGGIRSDGTVFTPQLDAGVITLDGDDLLEIIDRLPKGTIVWSGNQEGTLGPYSTRTGIWEFAFDAYGGRRYRIDITGAFNRSGGSAAAVVVRLIKTQATLGTTPAAPTVNGTQFPPALRYVPDGWIESTLTYWFQPSQNESTRWLFCIEPFSGATCQIRNFAVTVTDLGPNPENTGQPSQGGAGGSTPPSNPAPKDFVQDFGFTYDSHAVWTQYGRVTQSAYKPHLLRHGTGGSSRYRSYLPLISAARSKITGADSIGKIALQLTAAQDNWNVRPWIGTINTTNVKGSTEPTISNLAQASDGNGNPVTFKPGERKWITLTSAQVNAIRNGTAQGIAIGRTDQSLTLISFYGTTAAEANRPKIRVWGKD